MCVNVSPKKALNVAAKCYKNAAAFANSDVMVSRNNWAALRCVSSGAAICGILLVIISVKYKLCSSLTQNKFFKFIL